MIVTVPDLHLINGELMTSDGNQGFMKIHNQQGTLDGACSVYSVIMSLLYENIISYEETEKPGRTNGSRLVKELSNDYGLVKGGFYFKKLHKIIDKYSTQLWGVTHVSDCTPKECISRICNEIDKGYAPIIGVEYIGEEFGHALLAVGYEKIEDKIMNIFCLDPGAPTPITSIWNSYIDVHNLKKSSKYVNNLTVPLIPNLVKIREYLLIENYIDIPISLHP